jgi:hypothetical protein
MLASSGDVIAPSPCHLKDWLGGGWIGSDR